MNILLISTLYPEPEGYGIVNDTKAVHYFAREWVKMGHQVVVFHPYRNPLPKILSYNKGIKSSRIEGVEIVFGQNQLLVPHNFVPYAFQQEWLANRFLRFVKYSLPGFVPDVVSVHFPLCSLIFAETILKGFSVNGQIAYVFHGSDIRLLQKMNKEQRELVVQRLCKGSTTQLYRSYQLRKTAIALGMPKLRSDVVLSGIDKTLIASVEDIQSKLESPDSKNSIRIVYAGRLNQQKRVDRIIKALATISNDISFTFTIIGDGDQCTSLQALVKEKGLERCVNFMGLQPRKVVVSEMYKSDVFVMVSENETLGLVYLEAMAQGCIPIGSRGEGIDGIIVDEKNGFLVNPQNVMELSSVLLRISHLDNAERTNLAMAAYDTAKSMSSEKMAYKYINSIEHEE